jgi:predicted RNase H-like HicB family nuclease
MHRYLIVVEKAANNYSAYAPDVPGCIATGATLDETLQTMREALEFHLEGLQMHGDPIPDEHAVYAVFVEVASPAVAMT